SSTFCVSASRAATRTYAVRRPGPLGLNLKPTDHRWKYNRVNGAGPLMISYSEAWSPMISNDSMYSLACDRLQTNSSEIDVELLSTLVAGRSMWSQTSAAGMSICHFASVLSPRTGNGP